MTVIPMTATPVVVDVYIGIENVRRADMFRALLVGWHDEEGDGLLVPIVMVDGESYAEPLRGQTGLEFHVRREGGTDDNRGVIGRWTDEATLGARRYARARAESQRAQLGGGLEQARQEAARKAA